MATTILGIDLGSYSVKVARLDAGFRSMHLLGIEEQKLPHAESRQPEGEPGAEGDDAAHAEGSAEDLLFAQQLRALEQLLHNQKTKGETSVIALGGEVTLRLVEMPFADPKKVGQALPFELAGQLMADLDDQIVDQSLARPMPGRSAASAGAAAGGGGGEEEPSSLWLAGCAPRALLQERLAALSALGLDPRLCAATALSSAALFVEAARSKTAVGSGEAAPELPLWVIDLGHRTTHICGIAPSPSRSGQVLVSFARTIARGGEQLTRALSRALGVDFERAEELKHMHGIATDAEPRVTAALREALRPLLRDLRQTLAAYVARYGEPPRCIHLTGGTAQLSGLAELISQELGVDAKALLPPSGAQWLQNTQRDLRAALSVGASDDAVGRNTHVIPGSVLVRRWPTGATAVGLALSATTAAPQLNFRKGELSYRTDYAFVREKAPYLLAFGAALLSCVVIWAWASLKVLEKESERLRLQLISETTALFGEPRTNGQKVSAELMSVLSGDKGAGLGVPAVSALDLLEDISRVAPKTQGGSPAHLDVIELNISRKKTELKATAGSAQYVDDLAAALAKLACFKHVQKGKVLTVRNIGPDNKPVDVKQFTLEITTTCP